MVLLPLLEHAPDQMASRPLLTLNVIELLMAKPADWVLPTATLIPAGLDITCSPLRPVAVTANVTFAPGGASVSAAVLVTPAKTAEIVTEVEAVTAVVVTVKVALLAPAGTMTLAGAVAAAELSESDTVAPPLGAAALKVTVPVEEVPPTTLLGLRETVDRVAPVDAVALSVSVALWVTPS